VLNKKYTTPVSKRTTHPVYAPEDATFDFPIYLSLADHLGVLELVVWDKQTLTKEYLGEVSIPLEDWFCDKDKDGKDKEKMYGSDQPGNEACIPSFMLFDMNTYFIH
jgi:phosphatidylserine decarboxylase